MPVFTLTQFADFRGFGSSNDTVFALGGSDYIYAGSGDDSIDGGDGGDTLIGGFGADTIQDFEVTNANEKIDLSGVSAITSFADLQANHLGLVGGV
ncbi:MAG: hypothetical protein AAGK82_12245, partial [Pseudomonadota bacterium]